MKIQVEDLSPVRKKLIIEVEPEKVKEEWETVYPGCQQESQNEGVQAGKGSPKYGAKVLWPPD